MGQLRLEELKSEQQQARIAQIKFNEQGLIPCIAVDGKTKIVLMQAYMNRESLSITLETGKVTYYSRSRQSLWTKGETSGHTQKLMAIYLDCDQDSILVEVEQLGLACHLGTRSCFYEDDVLYQSTGEVLKNLRETIHKRKIVPMEGSYTNYLLEKGVDKILKKVGEEATEVVIAAKNNAQELVYETADLMYHLLVLYESLEIDFDQVFQELYKRSR